MSTKIQLRVGEETKCLTITHDVWLTEQVNLAFEKLDSDTAIYIEHEKARISMAKRKTRIRGA